MGVSESIYKEISPEGVDVLLQWEGCKHCGSDLAHSSSNKQPTSLNNSISIGDAPHCLFIYIGWGANVCSMALDISDRKDQRPTPLKWSCQSGQTAGSRGKHLSLTHFIMNAVKPHRESKREKKKKKQKPPSPQPGKECRRIVIFYDGMNYECVVGIRKQWLKSWASSPSFLTLSPAAN